jgi:SAM-dependent methyltransferase
MRRNRTARVLDDVRIGIGDPVEAQYFDSHVVRFHFILDRIAELTGGASKRVLDVGCYPWHLGAALERLGHEVHGITSLHERMSRPRVHELNIERDEFPWPDGTFDLVVFTEVIEHLPQSPVPPLREMRRVTCPGGHLIVTTPNIASAAKRVRMITGRSPMYSIDLYFEDGGRGRYAYHRHQREYTVQELRAVLEGSGWHVHESGDFVAYADLLTEPPRPLRAIPARAAKYVAQRLWPGGADSVYAIGLAV